MDNNLERLSDISKIIRREVDLPVARPACWHNPNRNANASGGAVTFYLGANRRPYAQRIKDFVHKILRVLR